MRYFALFITGVVLIVAIGGASAGAISSAGLIRVDRLSPVEFVQDKQSSETVTQRVKRAWKELVGYKFDVICPAFPLAPLPLPLGATHATCAEIGKSRDDARAKCQSQHQLCQIADAKH
ncbi:MAG TPA: hypothetical protein VKT73_10405 [Xanthobacteraceae bacterium]|nr:hypothetical protein [Xanthobacteraceae bacterium]